MSLGRDLCDAWGRGFYLAVVGRFFIKLDWSYLNDILGMNKALFGERECSRNAIKPAVTNLRSV